MTSQLSILKRAFQLEHDRDLRAKLCRYIAMVRRYNAENRNGYPDQNAWDCGRQDAFGAKVDAMFLEFNAMKLAWDLKNNSTKRLAPILRNVLEWC